MRNAAGEAAPARRPNHPSSTGSALGDHARAHGRAAPRPAPSPLNTCRQPACLSGFTPVSMSSLPAVHSGPMPPPCAGHVRGPGPWDNIARTPPQPSQSVAAGRLAPILMPTILEVAKLVRSGARIRMACGGVLEQAPHDFYALPAQFRPVSWCIGGAWNRRRLERAPNPASTPQPTPDNIVQASPRGRHSFQEPSTRQSTGPP